MKFDVTIFADDLNNASALAKQVETYGFDGLWVAEAATNPFLPLAHGALATNRINLGTAISVAFPRSPMMMAQTAWDLAAASKGRFILGLGTQIKPHITKRFSTAWTPPVARLREYIQSLRAIWQSFQTGAPLNYEGSDYQFSLLTPFFSPKPIEHPDIPIYIAGVNTGLCQLAGELCNGFHVHSFHTPKYLREVIIPAIENGGDKTARTREDMSLSCAIFVVTGRNEEDYQANMIATKSQIAFYASTPSYSKVLELHGWQDIVPELNLMLRRNRWNEMWQLVSDEMLNEFAVAAPPDELPYKVRERYEGLLDRVGFYFPFQPDEADKAIIWEHAAKVMAS